MDNGHDMVAHSAQVPLCSTQLLISKLGIITVPLSVNLSTLVKSSHIKINQKDCVLVMYFHPYGTMTCSTIIHRNSNNYFARCPLAHACLPLLPKASTQFPRIQTALSWPNLSSPLKSIFMPCYHYDMKN